MPTPDASQYTQFRRYTSIAGDALGSVGSKISPFNTAYSIPMLSASSQALFLPSANKEKKFPSSAPSINGPIWVSEIGNGSTQVSVYGITTDPNDGTIIVCGETNQVLFNGSVGDTYNYAKAYVARYTKTGTFIAGATLGSGLTYVTASSVTTDVHGNIYVCGQTDENLNDSNITYYRSKGFCAKFSSALGLIHIIELGSGQQFTRASNIMVTQEGYVYVGGNTLDTDWNDDSPHPKYNYSAGFVIQYDMVTAERLSGIQYGSGDNGSTYITGLEYIPIGSGGIPFSAIAASGYSGEDLGAYGVPDGGGGGVYGFLGFTYFDMYPLGIAGIGSGDNFTVFASVKLAKTPYGVILWVGGQTNEYLNGENQYSLLAGGGSQGFVSPYLFGPGFVGFISTVGDEQNYTVVTALSSDNNKFYVGGLTNENLNTGSTYNGMVITGFTLQTDFFSGFTDIRQIGTGTSFDILWSMESDTFGNFYAGGWSGEHLPSGPSLGGETVIGYIAKIADQPKTYNTPIFFTQDPSDNGGDGRCSLDYTPPVTIDWGDGTVQTITNGSSGTFTHPYVNSGTYDITVDAGTGGEITLFSSTGTGIQSIDVSRCPTLVSLRCDGNYLGTLNVSGCPNLEYLRCNNSQLKTLDLSGLSHLAYLRFPGGDNAISSIHLEGCGLTDTTYSKLEDVIGDLSDGDAYPGRIYLDSNQQIRYFDGDAADYFSGSLPNWTFIIIPVPPPPTFTADLTGLTFDGSGDPGHSFYGTFTFDSTNVVTINFSNAPVSINSITHIQFQGPVGTISGGDTVTIENPTLTPYFEAQTPGNGNVYFYSNGSFPLTSSSIVTLTCGNAITSVTFSMF